MANLNLPASRVRVSEASDWRSAVTLCLSLLKEEGFVEQRYIDKVVESIASGKGLYMALGEGILLAHSRPEDGACKTGLSLVVLKNPIALGDNDSGKSIQLIFGLSAVDTHSHQELMSEFAKVLLQSSVRESLKTAPDVEAALSVLVTA